MWRDPRRGSFHRDAPCGVLRVHTVIVRAVRPSGVTRSDVMQEATLACDLCTARTERLVKAERTERDNVLLRQAVRELQEERGEDANPSYVLVLLHRIKALEANIETLSKRPLAA